ncbi:MAG: NAD(P)H-hydrate dehydratase [Pseudomonadota bacterium]
MGLPTERLLTCAQMASADTHTIQSGLFTGFELMQRAGAAIVDVVLCDYGDAPSVDVLCGPGNNGGDGYVVAKLLRERGVCVRVWKLGDPKKNTDSEIAASQWSGEACSLDAYQPTSGALTVDALFGAGFRGGLPDTAKHALTGAAENGPVLAVDLPSGVNGDTGVVGDAVSCAATVTFYRKKPAHCLAESAALCGDIHVANIGVVASVFEQNNPEAIYENSPSLWREELPVVGRTAHKYSRGHSTVFSGPRHGTGAARLAALAGQRAGAGAVTLLGSASAIDMQAHHVTSIMLKSYERGLGRDALAALNTPSTAIIGPGFSDPQQARDLVLALLENPPPSLANIVLDADALTAFEDTQGVLFEAIKGRALSVIMTPHEGEFRRLFPVIAGEGALGKHQKASAAAKASGAIVAYKGPDTIIASPSGKAVINTHSSPNLATAGSGDVLAGIIGSLTAQQMPPFDAACAGVWWHGEAGIRAGACAVAEDLVGEVPGAIFAARSM